MKKIGIDSILCLHVLFRRFTQKGLVFCGVFILVDIKYKLKYNCTKIQNIYIVYFNDAICSNLHKQILETIPTQPTVRTYRAAAGRIVDGVHTHLEETVDEHTQDLTVVATLARLAGGLVYVITHL